MSRVLPHGVLGGVFLLALAAGLAGCGRAAESGVMLGAAARPAADERAASGPAGEGLSAEGSSVEGPDGGSLSVAVSILPQEYFVERVAGERARVEALVRPGQAPETYEPTPRQMSGLAKARLYFRIGMPFEDALVSRIGRMLPDLAVIDTARDVPRRAMEAHGHGETAADRGEEEHEGNLDPHIWLDPLRVRIVARHIRDGLALADPGGRAAYEANCAAFVGELEDLHRRMQAILAPVRGRTFLVFHPAFGYLADAYGLEQVAVEAEGKEPSARQLARLIERAREERVRAVFLQPQFSPKSAEKVAEAVGASVVVLDDLARDYPANMERMARAIAEGLSR